jgi:hypothetical protein
VDLANVQWHKSSASNGNSGTGCVEIAYLSDDGVALRDTKDRTLPPHRYPTAQWSAFLAGIRAGEFADPK